MSKKKEKKEKFEENKQVFIYVSGVVIKWFITAVFMLL